jgi:hypothetical protein
MAAVLAVAVMALGLAAFTVSAVTPSTARAATVYEERYGGCTYSWGGPCYIWWGAMNYLVTMDPDHAVGVMGEARATFNGYKKAKRDGIERDVCGTIFKAQGSGQEYNWTCSWGEAIATYPESVGWSAIGTGVEYYGIALYDVAGWGNQ